MSLHDGNGFSGRRRPKSERPGRPSRLRDIAHGISGWTQTLPGRREVVTPCVDAGRLFVGGGFGSFEFYAFDAGTGKLAWQRHTRDDGPTAAVVKDGCVVFNTESCTVCVLDARTGETRWERWLGDPLLAQPAVGGGLVFMAWPAKGDHRLGAFDLQKGRTTWQAQIPGDVITAPVYSEGAVYVSTFDGTVSCFDASSGRPEWSESMSATSAPWVWKGNVFVSRRDPREKGPMPSESLWRARSARAGRMGEMKKAAYLRSPRGTASFAADLAKDTSVGFGSAPAAAKLDQAERLTGSASVSRAWSYQGSRPCVWNGNIYSVVGDELTARDVESDAELWTWKAGFDDTGDFVERALTPPAVTNGRVYAGTRDGQLRCWDAGSGESLFAYPVASCLSWQPVVANGWLYCGAPDGRLVALHTGDPKDDGWPMWGGGAGHCGAGVD